MDTKSLLCSINEEEFVLFSDYIAEKSGVIIPPEKAYLIETKLSKLMLDAGYESFKEFYYFLISNPDPLMTEKIINTITINETMWFRDASLWKALEELILPGFVEELRQRRKARVRVWSAAASTGQEVYSAVMCVDNYLKRNRITDVSLSDFDFLATDISSNVIGIAKKGRYDKISIMRGLSDYYRSKYFSNEDSAWDIDPKIRQAVRFERFNLQDSYRALGLFDIILCRYVLIYFSDESKREIVEKMRDSLTDRGVIFTGNYVLYELFKGDFDANHYDNLTYYSKKGKAV